MVLAMHLEKRGFRVEIADNGEKALALQKQMTFDAVLMDCQMPVMDGFETTRRWRAAEDAAKRVPIIAVTANAVAGDRERCLECGMNDYVPKPIDPNLLFQKLSTYLAPVAKKQLEMSHLIMDKNTKIELNLNALEALRDFDDGKGEVLTEVVKKFLETTPERLAPFKKHCADGRWEDVRHIAHTVKSSAATVGAAALSEIAKQIEHNMREKKHEGLEQDCETLLRVYAASQVALSNYLTTQRKAA
jgi:CheY-like chemotaxis protein